MNVTTTSPFSTATPDRAMNPTAAEMLNGMPRSQRATMPPVIICVLGVVGAVAAARWIAAETRRINAQLHPEAFDRLAAPDDRDAMATLRRDRSGIYRPE